MYQTKQRLLQISLLLLIGAVISLAYSPGLNGPYVLDDGENILTNDSIAISALQPRALYRAAMSGDAGALRRPLASLTFALNYYFARGFEPSLPFKITNLLVHLFNTALVFLLALEIAQTPVMADKLAPSSRYRFALFASGLWGLHPIQLTNVLYVVQRMNSLSAAFVLLGLILYVDGRLALADAKPCALRRMAVGIVVGMSGIFAKENACLILLFALVIEYCFFSLEDSPDLRRWVIIFHLIALGASAVLGIAYLVHHPHLLTAAYQERHFTMMQRVLTETRVLWFYMRLILLPDVASLGLFHDDLTLSTGLFAPPTTFFALAGIAVAFAGALLARRRFPVLTFAVLWFLAGHVLESSVFGLEIAYEHRNYLPSIGPLAGLAFLLVRLADRSTRRQVILWPLVALLLLALANATWVSSLAWHDTDSLAFTTVQHHPDSPRANDFAATVSLAKGDYVDGLHYMQHGWRLSPREVGFGLDIEVLAASLTSEINDEIVRRPDAHTEILARYALPLSPELQTSRGRNGFLLSPIAEWREQIPVLLASQPITVHGVVSLDNLFHCLTVSPRPCRTITPEALHWFAVAAENPHTSTTYRALILADSGRLYAQAHNYPLALIQVERAAIIDPSRVYYRLLRIEYLADNGKTQQAAADLAALKEQQMEVTQPSSKYYEHVQRLEHKLVGETESQRRGGCATAVPDCYTSSRT